MDLSSPTDAFMAAAADPSRWGAAMDALAQATGSFGATILPLGGRSPLSQAPVSASMEELASEYIRGNWRERDGLDAYRSQIMREGVAANPDFERSRWYQEHLRPCGVRWSASAKVGQETVALGLYRTTEQGPFTPEEIGKLRDLSLALGGVVELARAFEFRRIDAKLSAFERSQSPVATD